MSSIRVRAETGCLFFDFRYAGQRCREQSSLRDTPANRKKMEKMLAQIEADMSGGCFEYARYFPQSKMLAQRPEWRGAGTAVLNATASDSDLIPTAMPAVAAHVLNQQATPLFREFCSLWITENEPRWRASTRESVVGTINKHLLPRFGDRPVSLITKPDILLLRADLAKLPGRRGGGMLTGKTINHVIGVLKAVMGEAADRFGFPSPAANVGRLRQQRRDIEPFTFDQVRLILATVRSDFRSYYTVRFFTGMRTGEVDGLQWKYVDFERRQILVRETWTKGRTEYTKTDGSQREIEMSSVVFDALKAQEAITKGRSRYVFCDSKGGPLSVANVSDRVWAPLLRFLELPYRRMYQTRHTCATFWLASGENPEWIARQLGHVNTEMLFKTYSRFVPNLTRKDGSAFDRLLSEAMPGRVTAEAHGVTAAANDDADPSNQTRRAGGGGRHV